MKENIIKVKDEVSFMNINKMVNESLNGDDVIHINLDKTIKREPKEFIEQYIMYQINDTLYKVILELE